MKIKTVMLAVLLAAGLVGCVTVPTGPTSMALPGTGKDFEQFKIDDASCRQYGLQAAGATPGGVQEESGVKSAVVGTAIGAIAGAALGNTAQSAAAGAGIGLVMGAIAGAGAGSQSAYGVQRRYDNGYTQCMYAKGHRVAVPGGMARMQQPAPRPQAQDPQPPQTSQAPQAPLPPAGQQPQPPLIQPQVQYYPPPPPGSPPPPPSAIVR